MWSTLWTCKICLSNPIEVYRNRYIQFIQIIFWLRYIGPGMAVKGKRMKRKAGQKFLILAHKTDNISSKYRWCQELDKQSNFDEVEQIIELLCDLLELSSHMIVSISLPLTTLLLSWGGRSRDEHEMYTFGILIKFHSWKCSWLSNILFLCTWSWVLPLLLLLLLRRLLFLSSLRKRR